jgi:hypothetical protein
MIAPIRKPKRKRATPAWHEPFLAMLPEIRRQASIALRGLKSECEDDALAEILAYVACTFARLVERGKIEAAFPSVLVRHAVARYHEGRRTGTRLNRNNILTEYGRQKNGLIIESLDQRDQEDDDWRQLFLEDRHASPADLARWRIDVDQWLGQLPAKSRKVALKLAVGNSTTDAAQRFCVTPGRISQYRRQLADDWDRFYADAEAME